MLEKIINDTTCKIFILAVLVLTPLSFYFHLEIAAGLLLVAGSAVLAARFPGALFYYLIITSCISLAVIHDRKDLFLDFGGVDPNGIQLSLIIAVGLPILIIQMIREKVRIPAVTYIYVAFLAVAAFSLTYAPSFMMGLRFCFKLIYPIYILFLYLLLEKRKEIDLDSVLKLLLYTFTITLALALLLFAFGINLLEPVVGGDGWYPIVSDEEFYFRFLSPFGPYQSALGMMAAITCIISIHALIERKHTALAAAATVLTFTVLVLTFTRISFFSLLLVATSYLLLKKKYIHAASFVALCIVLVILTPLGSRTFQIREITPSAAEADASGNTDQDARSIESEGDATAAEAPESSTSKVLVIPATGREKLWPIAWDAFTGRPIFGNGLGATTHLLMEAFPDNLTGHIVHNEYLRIAAETGIVGIVLFLCFFVAVSIRLFIQWLRGNNTALMALSVLAIYGLTMITDNSLDYYRNAGFFVYLVLAMAIGRQLIRKPETP